MLSDSRKKKLDMLMRSVAQGQLTGGAELLRAHGHSGVNRGTGDELITPIRPVPLCEACQGIETPIDTSAGAGRYWLIRRRLPEAESAIPPAPLSDGPAEPQVVAEDAPDVPSQPISREYKHVLNGARHNFDELAASPGLCHAANCRAEDLLFMDIETCGLGSTMIFLVGVMVHDAGGLMCEQYLARDYSEEAAILQAFLNRYNECRVLVTFNGKSFDMTQITERSAFHGLDLPDRPFPHLDLLREARKRWKGQVPNYKLQTLERFFCQRHRVGDIPGSAIPDAYHDFVRTQDARRMADILHHNALDLLTMAQLLTIALTGCEPTTDD